MFKLIGGIIEYLKEIFLGRCWDFIENRGKDFENLFKVDCNELWEMFLKSFVFKGFLMLFLRIMYFFLIYMMRNC